MYIYMFIYINKKSEKENISNQVMRRSKCMRATKAYVVKRALEGALPSSSMQVTWSRHGGPKEAWNEAKRRAGLEVAEA